MRGTALILVTGAGLGLATAAGAETLTYGNVLQRVIARDASLDVARLQLERARVEVDRIESQLAWTLNGQAGRSHDLSAFGIPSDRSDASLSLEKRLSFGSRVGASGSYVYEDAEGTISPLFANPSTTTRADVFWRQPLARGFGNADYREGRAQAEAGIAAARADRIAVFDQLARRTADVYYTAAFTHARLASAGEAIVRSERLKEYVLRNVRLGVAEEKDRLQAEAVLSARRAERDAVQLAWVQHRTTLNRLLERDWNAELVPVLPASAELPPVDALQAEAERHSPELMRYAAQERQADAVIGYSRDRARDQFDAVLSLGRRNISGDTIAPPGSVDISEPAASLRLEYRATLGRSAADADLSQAYTQRAIAQRQLAAVRTDLEYRIQGLRAELDSARSAFVQAQARVQAERAKMDEASVRYRRGRSDTAQLVQFENDLRAAELVADQQAAELARRQVELDILRGALWEQLGVPAGGNP